MTHPPGHEGLHRGKRLAPTDQKRTRPEKVPTKTDGQGPHRIRRGGAESEDLPKEKVFAERGSSRGKPYPTLPIPPPHNVNKLCFAGVCSEWPARDSAGRAGATPTWKDRGEVGAVCCDRYLPQQWPLLVTAAVNVSEVSDLKPLGGLRRGRREEGVEGVR